MALSSNACGVLATVIPVYFLVLYVGRDGLVDPRNHGLKPTVFWHAIPATLLILTLTLAECLVIFGLLFDQGLGVWTSAIVVAAAAAAALHVALFAVIDAWARTLDR